MAYANLSTWDEALKVFYLPTIQPQLNTDTYLKDKIEVNEMDVSGKNATIECWYGRSTGVGARADGGTLPSANYQKFQTATVPMKYKYGRVSFTGPTIRATRDEKGAYARVVDTEIRGIVEDVSQEANRMLWGCGYGVLGRWRSDSTTTYTFSKLYRGNVDGSGATVGDGFGSTFGGKYVEEIGAAAAVTQTGNSGSEWTGITVDGTDMVPTAVDSTGSTDYDTVTMTSNSSASPTEAAGSYFIRPANSRTTTGSNDAGYARLESMGLRGIVTNEDLDSIALFDSTGAGGNTGIKSGNDALQNLAVGTYPWWKANVAVASAGRYQAQRPVTFELMDQMFDKVELKAGKDYGPDTIMTTHAIRREYLKLCRIERRQVNSMMLEGGWTGLDFNGIPLMVDKDAIDGEMYFLTLKDLQIYRMSDYDWMTKDNAILSRISGVDAYEAVLFRYDELGAKRRNSHGVICDLAYTADR